MKKSIAVLPILAAGAALSIAPSALSQSCGFTKFNDKSLRNQGQMTTNINTFAQIGGYNSCNHGYQTVSAGGIRVCQTAIWGGVANYFANSAEIAAYSSIYSVSSYCYQYRMRAHYATNPVPPDQLISRQACTIGNNCS